MSSCLYSHMVSDLWVEISIYRDKSEFPKEIMYFSLTWFLLLCTEQICIPYLSCIFRYIYQSLCLSLVHADTEKVIWLEANSPLDFSKNPVHHFKLAQVFSFTRKYNTSWKVNLLHVLFGWTKVISSACDSSWCLKRCSTHSSTHSRSYFHEVIWSAALTNWSHLFSTTHHCCPWFHPPLH